MSRVGNAPIELPAGVEVTVGDGVVEVKGPKGNLTEAIDARITTSVDDGVVSLSRADEERETRALHGLSRTVAADHSYAALDHSLEIEGRCEECA